jgi:hypothetical protein
MSRVPGTFKHPPAALRRDLSPEGCAVEQMFLDLGALYARRYTLGECTAMVAREPTAGGHRWHLSVAHPTRYPSWDELKAACYGAAELQGVTLAQVLTPGDGSVWVNLHDNCFHLYEIRDPAYERA